MKSISAAIALLFILSVAIQAEPKEEQLEPRKLRNSRRGGHRRGKGDACESGKGKGGSGKGKGKGKGSSDLPPKDSMTLDAKCAVFDAYYNAEHFFANSQTDTTRRQLFPIQNDPDVEGDLCESFDPLDPYVCPTPNRAVKICAEPKPENNKAVKERYCEPLFRDVCDDDERDFCVRRCIQYVSQAQGDCCSMECE